MSKGRTLRLRVRAEDDLVFSEKPSGFNTHASDVGRTGWVELLQEELGVPLFVAHRLDAGTSGALVFAKTSEAAAELTKLFETRAVKKKYRFVTDRPFAKDEASMKSRIEKRGSSFVSEKNGETNAVTTFRRLKKVRLGDLWEATPETGKPHQIRLHAQDLGLPILGDDAHGGSPFVRLCLHSKSLEFPWRGSVAKMEASEPAWADDLESPHAVIADAARARATMFDLEKHPNECLRLVHLESNLCRIDQYGSQLVTSWYADQPPTEKDLRFFETLANEFSKTMIVRMMQNKGVDPNTKTTWTIGSPPARWTAEENGARFELRADMGQSPGLFLDQRENRLWVRENARGKKVLNLFSYTGAFSVNAALGDAAEICTVDVSGGFNDWTKENFRQNGLDPARPGLEYWNQDCLLFLKGAAKRKRTWDLIVCDPPSFGRSKDGVFQIQKNAPELLELCLQALSPGGRLLFSTNYEKWTLEDLRKLVLAQRRKFKIDLEKTPRQGLDFERPDQETLMKAVIVTKR